MIKEIRDRYWVVSGEKTAYIISVLKSGELVNPYWGEKLDFNEEYPSPQTYHENSSFDSEYEIMPEEYPCPGKMKFVEPCLFLKYFDGTRDMDLQYDRAEINGDHLLIIMKDQAYDFVVNLHYQVYADVDIVKKWVVLENYGKKPILFSRILSGQLTLPDEKDYELTHFYGRWFREFDRDTTRIPFGKIVLESRRLTSSHQHSPAVIVHDLDITEESGTGYFGILGWSGNWKASVEKNSFRKTRISMGVNDFDFSWNLKPAETFTSPPLYFGMTKDGLQDISYRAHDFVRKYLLPHPEISKKVLYNSWEATEFAVNSEHQMALAKIAAEVGVELFVLDDGWFHGRNSDKSGLGDWWPDEKKFPHGIKPLSDYVHELGMDFGLWIEPEMVNPDSELYRNHPDWILHFPNRVPTLARNQMILNITRKDVQDYLFTHLVKVIRETGVDFIKWDMNRNVSEPGGIFDHDQSDQSIWVNYVYAMYTLWEKLREEFPEIIFQSCSGGGGRSDFGMLTLADQVWVSDKTEPNERLFIQEGFSQFYPASVMEAWVTDMGEEHLSLDYRFAVSMMGVLGIGSDIGKWSESDRSTAKKWITFYKNHRHIIQHGDQSRLLSVRDQGIASVLYMDKNKSEGVLFVVRSFFAVERQAVKIKLRNLDPEKMYAIPEINLTLSGSSLMRHGINIDMDQNFSGKLLTIKSN